MIIITIEDTVSEIIASHVIIFIISIEPVGSTNGKHKLIGKTIFQSLNVKDTKPAARKENVKDKVSK